MHYPPATDTVVQVGHPQFGKAVLYAPGEYLVVRMARACEMPGAAPRQRVTQPRGEARVGLHDLFLQKRWGKFFS